MRAILLDPERKSITEITLESADCESIGQVLDCDSITTGAHLRGSLETGFDAIYVSDDPFEYGDVLPARSRRHRAPSKIASPNLPPSARICVFPLMPA
jgi:hypothetical protein